ncbi:MAG: GGDEF domain-containing protein [Candidatus Thiodiazotropha sp. (ex Monitilora ramsayi)]|nr:GGDEF domain-containing protein [Candidatus Thiodiazotropha sp. (ex Monitilora ramsayi)]
MDNQVVQNTNIDTFTGRELLDLLYKNAPITLFSSMVVTVLLLSTLYGSYEENQIILSWALAQITVNLLRLILRSVRESTLIHDRYSQAWLIIYTILTFCAGVLWSLLVVILQENFSLYDHIIILVTLIGIPLAALPNNALKLPVYYAFTCPILFSLQYWSYFISQESNLEFSVLALAYSAIVMVTGHIYHNSFKNGLRVKYEKHDLVDELSSANQRLEEFAYIDPLTGLTNRRWFSEQADRALERCLRRNTRLAVLLIDLDNFKEINDTLGHAMGDEILIVIAKRLKSALRLSDTLSLTKGDTARYGGDEFIVLLEDFDEITDVERISERILQEVNETVALNEHQFNPGCSIGISIFPDDGESFSNLIRQADIALYQAKQSGKGCTRFFNARSVDLAELKIPAVKK